MSPMSSSLDLIAQSSSKLLGADKSALLNVGTLKLWLAHVLLKLLDEFRRTVRGLGEHDRRVTFQYREKKIKLLILQSFDNVGEQCVLYNCQLDALLKA